MALLKMALVPGRRHVRLAACLVGLIFLQIVLGPGAKAEETAQLHDEYQVKAAFIYNFAKFVEWPSHAFAGPADPITICVLGQDSVSNPLQEVVMGKEVGGRPLLVRQLSDGRQAGVCRILFVSSSERRALSTLLAGAHLSGVLTVGEAEGFTRQGGMINFKIEGGRVRFEINADAAQQEGVHISSKLLSLAQSVRK